jgi:signal peptidase
MAVEESATATPETRLTRAEVQRARRQASRAKRRRQRRRRLGWTLPLLVIVAAIAVGFVTLRPQALGGSLVYVEMHGSAMVPDLHDGDLVVAQRQATYGPREVVVYRVPTGQPRAGQIVIARIVGGSTRTGFVTRGDHNPVADPARPTPADILGEVRVHLPVVAALIALGVVVAVIIAAGAITTGRRRRIRRAVAAPTVLPSAAERPRRVLGAGAPGLTRQPVVPLGDEGPIPPVPTPWVAEPDPEPEPVAVGTGVVASGVEPAEPESAPTADTPGGPRHAYWHRTPAPRGQEVEVADPKKNQRRRRRGQPPPSVEDQTRLVGDGGP